MRASAAVLVLLIAAVLGAPDARAGMLPRDWLFFSGADGSSISGFSWAGAEAPLLRRPDGSGPVLRLMAGAGHYDYARDGAPDGKVIGNVMLGELLAGWPVIRGDVCLTILAGLAVEDHELDVDDPENEVQGTDTGPKFAAELFWRPTAATQVEASAAYAATFEFWRVRAAAGRRIWKAVAGLEAEAFGNEGSDQVRLGLFVSDVNWRRYSFKASAGVLDDGETTGAYGRIGMERRF